ncbi:MAG: PEP/pyruvate-binding domain-containing protein [Phycisphaeraceae bacterium]
MLHRQAQPMTAGAYVQPLAACCELVRCGGKAVQLGALLRAGLTVPGGFCVTTAAYQLATASDEAVPEEVAEQVVAAYQAMGSPAVAVRSSATAEDAAGASMAGQHETVLNVQGPQAVLDAVARCWQSLGSARAEAYRTHRGVNEAKETAAMAVVVQELVPAAKAGVLFTTSPTRGATHEMLIEAAFGLGESVVSGEVQPDTLRLDRATGAVLEARIARKARWVDPATGKAAALPEHQREIPCLNAQEVDQLYRLGLEVAEQLGRAQDVEWAIAGERLWVLQARPITTLADAEADEALLTETRERLREQRRAGRGPWVLHNLAETLDQPTPLTWSVIGPFMTGGGGFGNLYRLAGFEPSPAVKHEGFLELIGGRIYQDLARAPELYLENYPFAYDEALLRRHPERAQDPPTTPTGGLAGQLTASRKLRGVEQRMAELSQKTDRQFEQEQVPAFLAWVEQEQQVDLAELSTQQWIEAWRRRRAKVLDEFAPISLLPSLIAGYAIQRLRALLDEHAWDEDPDRLVSELSAGETPDSTVRSTAALAEVARGEQTLEQWLEAFGHRAPGEMELASPRWREHPERAQAMTEGLENIHPLDRHQRRLEQAREQAAAIERRLPERVRGAFRQRLALVQRYVRFREDGKDALMAGYALLRELVVEAGRRLEVGEDVCLLSFEELHDALLSGYAPLHLIERRRTERAASARLRVPPFVGDEQITRLGEPPEPQEEASDTSETPGTMRGFALTGGVATGRARVRHRPDEGAASGRFEAGDVLICPSTDPSWTPLFAQASALVLERGGTLSHGAVVAREMGLPAVVIEGATERIAEGASVTVDADHGIVILPGGDAAGNGQQQVAPNNDAVPAADPEDPVLPRAELPPPVSGAERAGARVATVATVAWTLVLVAGWLLPPAWLNRPAMRVLDELLLPAMAALGRPALVVVLAVALGAGLMALQKLVTDNARLVEAKKRAGQLRRAAAQLPAASARRRAMEAAAKPVQGRVLIAAMVPLAVVLGPLILLFTWCGVRVPPSMANAPVGTAAYVTAQVAGDFTGAITLETDPALALSDQAPASQTIPQIRPVLEELHQEWSVQSLPVAADLPWQVRAAGEATQRELQADLGRYLAGPMPPRQVAWRVVPDADAAGRFRLAVRAGEQTLATALVLGDAAAPEPQEIMDPAQGLRQVVRAGARSDVTEAPVRWVKVSYQSPTLAPGTQVFWGPLAWVPGDWAWLVLYIAAYVPAMTIARRMLRVA